MNHSKSELTGAPLARLGFVHVTGLLAKRDATSWRIEADGEQLGRWDYNNNVFCATTEDGEVWVRFCTENKLKVRFFSWQGEFCPKGMGANVPLSNGEAVPSHILGKRVSNPLWIGDNGEFDFPVWGPDPDPSYHSPVILEGK